VAGRTGGTPYGPQVIYLIRHAEKPADHGEDALPAGLRAAELGVNERGSTDRHSLTPRGWQRAGALAVAFTFGIGPGTRVPGVVEPPTVLIAPDYGSPHENARHRTHQTLRPLGDLLGVAIGAPVAKGEERRLAEEHLLAATGQRVLVCWEHTHLSALLGELAARVRVWPVPAVGAAWPEERYDVTLVLTRRSDGSGYDLGQRPHLLLAGDSATPLPGF